MPANDFISIDRRAEGKSNLFRFVTLRNPNSAESTSENRRFIRHLDPLQSVFVDPNLPLDSRGDYDFLQNASANFDPVDTIDSIININPDLYRFSDWLVRNQETIATETIADHTTNVEELLTAQENLIWDNIFYFTIRQDEVQKREALLLLLLGSNFLKKYQDNKIVQDDYDLRQLAGAKVIIPKSILSRKTGDPILEEDTQFSALRYNTVDQELVKEKIDQYKVAITELEEVNRIFVGDLNEVDPKEINGRPGSGTGSDGDTAIGTVNKTDFLKITGEPLGSTNLEKIVSEDTRQIVKDLNLDRLKDPVTAITALESEVIALNKQAFSDVVVKRDIVAAGGSIIELDRNPEPLLPGFVEGCFPTIVDAQNISINDNLSPPMNNAIYSLGVGYGNVGGASQEKISEYGSISFSVNKLPQAGTSFFVGLSPQNTDAGAASIKYAIKIERLILNGIYICRATPYMNNVPLGGSVSCYPRDTFRISRISGPTEPQIVWHRHRSSDNLLTLLTGEVDESGGSGLDELVFDFAFSHTVQAIFNVRMTPCDDDGSNSGGSENEDIPCSGITNLGVADYLRVEQEICCYVPGEVSHIENVMQGEYKERSTRRLRRQETTTTFETETTTEKLKDTTTTDRYEMEQESSQVIKQDSSTELGVTLSTKFGPTKLTVDTGFATSTSSTQSNKQAVSYAREVSTRALERVTNRVREERINKIIEEFEENNLHGLDNRNNTEGHVTGLYRWVDKIYKNQIVNYGKRLTFEFMVPEPAKFHLWAMAQEGVGMDLSKPEDPRKIGLPKHDSLSEYNYAQWVSSYDIQVNAPPPLYKTVSQAYHLDKMADTPVFAKSFNDFKIPDGYKGISADVWMYWIYKDNNNYRIEITVGDQSRQDYPWNFATFNLGGIEETIPIAVAGDEVHVFKINVVANCRRKDEVFEQWQIETFNKIIEAYQEKKAAYDNALAQAQAEASLGIQISGNNPLYNRTIEQQELQKGCLRWLDVEVGANAYDEIAPCPDDPEVMMPHQLTLEEQACFAQKAKFFEQAFDWSLMSYLFYPYFWGQKCSWKEIYRLDDNDPIFRGFLQAGMARVVVPVKPNYEEAVMYYMETGEIWNGGEVPVPEDPLYISIVDDLAEQQPTPVGDPWETRVPTSLSVLQKNSGAVSGDGLPCNCDDYEGDGTGGSNLDGSSEGGIGRFVVS